MISPNVTIILLPVVPHKAVAEVSKDGPKVVVFFGVVAVVAVVTSRQLLDVV